MGLRNWFIRRKENTINSKGILRMGKLGNWWNFIWKNSAQVNAEKFIMHVNNRKVSDDEFKDIVGQTRKQLLSLKKGKTLPSVNKYWEHVSKDKIGYYLLDIQKKGSILLLNNNEKIYFVNRELSEAISLVQLHLYLLSIFLKKAEGESIRGILDRLRNIYMTEILIFDFKEDMIKKIFKIYGFDL